MWNCWTGAHAHWQFYSHRRWQVAPTSATTTATTATPTPTHRHRSGCCQTPTVVSELSLRLPVSFFVRPLLHCTLLTAGVAAGSALDQQQQQQETLRLLEAFQQYVLFSTRLAAITCNNLKAMPEQGGGRTNNNTKGFENGPVYLNCKVRVHSELQSCELYAYFV